MKIEVTRIIESSKFWFSKGYGVIFVDKKENIKKVYEILVEQDEYWERADGKNEIIKLVPENLTLEKVKSSLEYVGKTDIYDFDDFESKLNEEGIDYFIWSQMSDEE